MNVKPSSNKMFLKFNNSSNKLYNNRENNKVSAVDTITNKTNNDVKQTRCGMQSGVGCTPIRQQ